MILMKNMRNLKFHAIIFLQYKLGKKDIRIETV